MDLLSVSTSWRNSLRISSSAARDSDEEDEDLQTQLDFPVGYDSEEEQQREMEEFLYCQMYIESSSEKCVESSGEESDYRISDLNKTDIPLILHSKENDKNPEVEEMKQVKRQRIEDCTDVARSHKKLKKSNMMTGTDEILNKKLLSKESPEEETVYISSSKISDESFHSPEVVLLSTDSEKSETSDSEPFLVKDESECEETSQTQQSEKKRSQKMGKKEVVSVSDSSSDSSLFLDISSDDDIDVHMVKSRATCDQGEDDEHLQAVLNSLPECEWKINNTDRFGSSYGEKSRYYNSASKFRCNNCNHRGHFADACPEPMKVKACILCGNRGHLSRYCYQSLCFNCNRPGHSAKECDGKRIWHEDACHRCSIQGHFMSDCPDRWRQYHLTTGNGEIVKGPKMENHRKFCYNCAATGHFGHECRRRRQDNYVQPLVPFIIRYDRKNGKRSQDESLSPYVAGKKFFLVQHSKLQNQKEAVQETKGKLLNQRDLQSERMTSKKSNYVNLNPLEYDRSEEAGKGNSFQWTNFAREIKDKLFGMKLKSAKNSLKKPNKAKDVLQLDYVPLTTSASGSEVNLYGSFQRITDLESKVISPSDVSDVSSLSKSVIYHTPINGPGVRDFPPSKVKASKDQDLCEYNRKRKDSRLSNYDSGLSDYLPSRSWGCYSKKLLSATPKELKTTSKTINSSSSIPEWQRTSTPASHTSGCRQEIRELLASEMQQFEGDQMLEAYYGKKQIRNARRKERRKKKRCEMLALDKANLSLKSEKKSSTRRGIETERGFQITVL